MNTKNKQDGKNKGPMTRQKRGSKKGGRGTGMHHEHELPEMRLTR